MTLMAIMGWEGVLCGFPDRCYVCLFVCPFVCLLVAVYLLCIGKVGGGMNCCKVEVDEYCLPTRGPT